MIRQILHIISIWIIVLPVTGGFINYKGLNKDSRWIFLLVCIALVPQLLTFFINKENPALNVSYNVYTPLEFVILYCLFQTKFEEASSRIILYISSFIYAGITLFMFITNGITDTFINSLVCVNNLVYMCWILFFLKEQYQAEETVIQRRNPFAWYLLALIIYAPCSSITFALYHYIREPDHLVLMELSVIQDICNILLYVLFSVGLFLGGQRTR